MLKLSLLFQKYVESSVGWAGERGEDSSYDSECEDESAHRAASRTPSDTLAAEFAEYVTLTPPQPNPVRSYKLITNHQPKMSPFHGYKHPLYKRK